MESPTRQRPDQTAAPRATSVERRIGALPTEQADQTRRGSPGRMRPNSGAQTARAEPTGDREGSPGRLRRPPGGRAASPGRQGPESRLVGSEAPAGERTESPRKKYGSNWRRKIVDANSEAVGPNGMVGVKGHTQGRDGRTALGNVSYMELDAQDMKRVDAKMKIMCRLGRLNTSVEVSRNSVGWVLKEKLALSEHSWLVIRFSLMQSDGSL